MRVAFTSDLHVDITAENRALVPHLIERIKELSPDALVLAGDIANNLDRWSQTLAQFDIGIPKLIVPGNHDVWCESRRDLRRGHDSTWKYSRALPERAEEFGFKYLASGPEVLDGVGFVGTLGWYDYSLRDGRLDETIPLGAYQKGEFGNLGWNDTRYAAWLREPHSQDWRRRQLRFSDEAVCTSMESRFLADLDSVAAGVQKIVAVVHTCPFEACVERSDPPDFFDAYVGAARYGEALKQVATTHSVAMITGHVHHPLDRAVCGVRVVRSPVGYLEKFSGDLCAKAREVVGLLEI
jgi:Icc-related predicted phosphoesterase